MLEFLPGALISRASPRSWGPKCIWVKYIGRRFLATVADYAGLPPPSPEQDLVVKALKQGRNARVNAVAGSGKTTTILQVAQAFPNRRILALLYNRRLKEDMRYRQQMLNLTDNLQVDNYHGLGYTLYDAQDCATDQGLKRLVLEDPRAVHSLDFDLLCLDELQDATPIIYAFIRKLMRDNKSTKNLQYVVLGDPRQEIYAFNHADKRFLTMAKTAFPSTRRWTSIEHRTSYRATNELVKFYNKQLLNPSDTPLNAVKTGKRPRYLICNSYSDTPLEELLRYLSLVDPSQVLVLAPSIRSMRSPVRDLANKIAVEYPSISCYIPTSDEETLSPTLLDGKLLFCTYHQAKGIEREAVLMFCFDTSFYKLYNRAGDKSAISNAQYVGATRSSQYLTVIHDTSYDYLPFLDRDTLADHCDMYVEREPLPDAIEDPEEKKKLPGYAVTDLTRHVPEAVTSYCFEGFFRPELERPPAKYRVYPPTTIWLENGLLETVADITGSAIPAIYEYRSRGTCTLLENVQEDLQSLAADENAVTTAGEEHPFHHLPTALREKLLSLTPASMDLSDFLLVANASNTSISGYVHKMLQIKEYNWLEEKHIKPAMAVLQKHISSYARYERNVRGRANGIDIRGRVDVIDGNTLWELKWTDSLRPEHVLQLVCYAALDSIKHPNRAYKLLHVPTRQIVVVKGNGSGFMRVLEELVKVRMEGNRSLGLTDEAFKMELGREFEGFVGGLTIPTWLNTRIAQSK